MPDAIHFSNPLPLRNRPSRCGGALTAALAITVMVTLIVAPCAAVHAQAFLKPTLDAYYMKARYVHYAPDASHLLVTLCETIKGDWGCHPWRYHLQARRWEKVQVAAEEPDWSIHSATFSPDGKTIAISYVKCLDRTPHEPLCPLTRFRVGLVDAASGAMRPIIPSEQGRLMPAFSSDGKHILYYGVDHLGWYSSGRAAYANFNLYMMDADGGNPKRVIQVKTGSPLAPPKMLADGKTVTISGRGVMGQVTHGDALLEHGMLIDGNDFREDSVILGDIASGSMRTLLPPGSGRKVVVDISADERRLLYVGNYDLKELQLDNVADQKTLRPVRASGGREVRHASYAPQGNGFAYVQGGYVIVSDLNAPDNGMLVLPPIWSPPKPIPVPPILEG